jgi:peptidoglycan/xylan/chitin deacetylase (PgdA/CDA1 family)
MQGGLLKAAVLLFSISSLSASGAPIATILSYHQVEPGGVPQVKTVPRSGAADTTAEEARYAISVDDFNAQLDYLQQSGCHVIPLADLVDYIEGRRDALPSKPVVITVDDGWLSAYTQIFPVMQQRKLPFTLFIYPEVIGVSRAYVTWPQVVEMTNAGVDIESHTFTHPFLTRDGTMSDDEYQKFLDHELGDSKAEIEKHIGKTVRFIAYPYSTYDAAVEQAVARHGYEAALYDRDYGALIGCGTPLMHLKRFPLTHGTTLEQFKAFLPPNAVAISAGRSGR